MNYSLLVQLLQHLAENFDTRRFPVDAYFDFLDGIAAANDFTGLADRLEFALSWKDGKVQVTPDTDWSDASPYRVLATRPNTLSARHGEQFRTEAFYSWADRIRRSTEVDLQQLQVLRQTFGLWSSTTIPVFVMHCLAPNVYPIIDQHVMRAFRLLSSGVDDDTVSTQAYAEYTAWWRALCAEAGIDIRQRDFETIRKSKVLDAGLWELGRRLRNESASPTAPTEAPERLPNRRVTTSSPEFRERAQKYAALPRTTQREAMAQAAQDFGLVLPSSYTDYPGSHFYRWQQQRPVGQIARIRGQRGPATGDGLDESTEQTAARTLHEEEPMIHFPHANGCQVPLTEFVVGWKVLTETYGPADADWRTTAMPRRHAAQGLSAQLAAHKHWSVDVLARVLVPAGYRNTMQATGPFMDNNAGALAPVDGRPSGARLTDAALRAWDALAPDEQQRLEASFHVRIGQALGG